MHTINPEVRERLLSALDAALDAQTPSESDLARVRLLRLIDGARWLRCVHAAEGPEPVAEPVAAAQGDPEHIGDILPRVIQGIADDLKNEAV